MAVAMAIAIVLALGVGLAVRVSKQAALTKKIAKIGGSATSFYKADTAWQRQKALETVRNFTLGGHAVARFCLLAALVALGLSICRAAVLLLYGGCRAKAAVDLTGVACPERFHQFIQL